MMAEKKMGRPATPEYTKKRFRYAKVEREVLAALENMKYSHDKEIILAMLEKLKGA